MNTEIIREGLRKINRRAGVLKSDPYGLGLSLSQCSALIDISRFESLSPSELVETLNLEKSSISRLLTVISKKGLVEVKVSDFDKRVKRLTLTDKGKRAVMTINKISNKTVEELLETLSARDRALIMSAFKKINQSLE